MWRTGCSAQAALGACFNFADGGVFVSTATPGPEDGGRGARTVRLPLTDLAAVHDRAIAGQLSGKTVLTPASST